MLKLVTLLTLTVMLTSCAVNVPRYTGSADNKEESRRDSNDVTEPRSPPTQSHQKSYQPDKEQPHIQESDKNENHTLEENGASDNSGISKSKPRNFSPEKNYKKRKGASISTGTGFFISADGYILTNQHVIDGGKDIDIYWMDNLYTAKIVEDDKEDDLALLKIEAESEFLSINLDLAPKGAAIVVLGYPNIGIQGNEQKATFGHINAHSGVKNDRRYYQMSAPVQPGNSGSPMLNSSAEVVGIVTSTLNQAASLNATGAISQNVNYALKTEYTIPMLGNVTGLRIASKEGSRLSNSQIVESAEKAIVLIIVTRDKPSILENKPKLPGKTSSATDEKSEHTRSKNGESEIIAPPQPNITLPPSETSKQEQTLESNSTVIDDSGGREEERQASDRSKNEVESSPLDTEKPYRNKGFQGIYKHSVR